MNYSNNQFMRSMFRALLHAPLRSPVEHANKNYNLNEFPKVQIYCPLCGKLRGKGHPRCSKILQGMRQRGEI